MRLRVTAVVLLALTLAACSQETAPKESPEQISSEQAAADAHNAGTVPFAGDDETPSTDPPSTPPATTANPEHEGLENLRVGDCVNLPAADVATVRAIPCDRPHHAEVTARVNVSASFPNGAPTPEDYSHITGSVCQQAFDAYVAQPPPQNVRADSLDPTPALWFNGVRDVIC